MITRKQAKRPTRKPKRNDVSPLAQELTGLRRTRKPPAHSGHPSPSEAAAAELYRDVLGHMDQGFCIIEVLFDHRNHPCDYRFLEANAAFETHTGLTGAVGRRMREFAPKHEQYWFDIYGKVAMSGEPVRLINEASQVNQRWFDVNAFRVGRPEERKVAALYQLCAAFFGWKHSTLITRGNMLAGQTTTDQDLAIFV